MRSRNSRRKLCPAVWRPIETFRALRRSASRSVPHGRQAGFTLIEMLVALAIFSLAALTLLRMEGASLSQTADLDRRLVQEIVAQNLAVEWLTDPRPPALGEARGEASNYGRSFAWERQAELIAEGRLMRITVLVRDAAGDGSAFSLELLRPVL